MKRIAKIAFIILLFVTVLYFGGYNWLSFSRTLEIKNPSAVLEPLKQAIPSEFKEPDPLTGGNNPDVSYTDDSDPTIVTGTDPYWSTNSSSGTNPLEGNETLESKTIDISYKQILSITINGETMDLSSTTSASFVKWLALNYNGDVTFTDKDGEVLNPVSGGVEVDIGKTDPTETGSIDETDTTESTEPTQTTINPAEVTPLPSVNPKLVEPAELSYDDTLKDYAHLQAIVADIQVVDELPNYNEMVKSGEWTGYNRDDYEKPTKSYILGGIKVNRNNYAWMSSPFFNQKDFTYTCPYTGTIITDKDDKKPNNGDFESLDYDHIVPLKSTYLRGGANWTNTQRNEYAYDQWVAVDVLASANRSKGDKGPLEYLPEKNIEDYCYSWLLICSKYDLVMTEQEIALCQRYINDALQRGEPVTHLGGHYEAA